MSSENRRNQVQCVVCECSEDSCESCKNPELCSLKNCNTCCCEETHTTWRNERIHRALVIEYLSVAWMSIEVIGAFAAGALAGSFALIAFGSDSVVELASAFVVLKHLRLDDSGSNAQGEKSALFTSLLLLLLIPAIGIGATYSFFFLKIQPAPSILGIGIALGAVALMPFLWLEKRKIGSETRCLPLSIDAVESSTCFFMSLVLLAGLVLEYLFRIGWFDYAATLVILCFIAYEAREAYEEARQRFVGQIKSRVS